MTLSPISKAHLVEKPPAGQDGAVYEIPAPMLAKAVPDIPDPAKTPGGLSFEPKWDGFLH